MYKKYTFGICLLENLKFIAILKPKHTNKQLFCEIIRVSGYRNFAVRQNSTVRSTI